MKVAIVGGGPAGLYCGLLLKKANPVHQVEVVERNAPDATYGWGVVFSDRTLASFQEADLQTYRAIKERFVLWDAIDIYYRGALIRCGGHVFAGLARKELLGILQKRCLELGVSLRYHTEIGDLAALGDHDLIIAADGVNSLARSTYADTFKPSLVGGQARYIWLGAEKVLEAFTFIFRENEAGLFQVHAYPFDGTTSTVIVECAETTWRRAGLDAASEAESIAYCERLFAQELAGCRLLSNNSKWISFVTVKNARWSHQNVVLLGDAAHTAHFSIGSGTKLAMEDAIALANALHQHPTIPAALNAYELERKPVVETFQHAAAESQAYFEHVDRYAALPAIQFAFNLLTRSGRISYDDLRLRDARFGARVDREFAFQSDPPRPVHVAALYVPPPLFTPLRLRDVCLSNRVALSPIAAAARGGWMSTSYAAALMSGALSGAGLILSTPVAISHDGRISPDCAGLYEDGHAVGWREIVEDVHRLTAAKVGIALNHAGRRGSTRPRREGLDRPLREARWPLVAPSPLAFMPGSQIPQALDRAGMDAIRDDFLLATRRATQTGCDLLQLHMGHGYLLASFLSPLTNRRDDQYGGSLENRMRFPLQVFDAVRAVWPADKPLSVALNVTDCLANGFTVEDGVAMARALHEHGCDLLMVLAGQTTPTSEPPYGRGFLTPLGDRLRNEAGIPTLVGGYLTTTNDANTILAGGRADLCLLTPDERTPLDPGLDAQLSGLPDAIERPLQQFSANGPGPASSAPEPEMPAAVTGE